MGKVLIIKGADFSGVNVDIIPVFVNSELDLTKQNYLRSAQAYISSEGKWGTGGANTKTLFWPISAGQILRLGSNPDDGLYFCISQGFESIGNAIQTIDGQIVNRINYGNPDFELLARENGYVAISYLVEGQARWPNPDTAKIIADSYPGTRVLSYDDAIGFIDKYINSSTNTWGNETAPTGKHPGVFYNVFKGETVRVKANANSNTNIAFIRATTSRTAEVSYAEGTGRNNITKGTEQSFTVPEDCYLYVSAYSGNTESFPEELEIIGITL